MKCILQITTNSNISGTKTLLHPLKNCYAVGEIVYMGPVTLNKDNLVNKAGMEIDIIPIKRSPCSSPQPRRPIKQNFRARSEMGFYTEKDIVEDTNSLPDLERVDKRAPKFKIEKGQIMSAVIKFNTDMLSRSYEMDSTSSSVYNSLQNISPFLRRQSDSITKGSLVNLVKEWMEKSSPFGSSENVRSLDTNSLADTNISIFDDDDSVEISYSDCGVTQNEPDVKPNNLLPDIFVFSDENVPSVILNSRNESSIKDELKDNVENGSLKKKDNKERSHEGNFSSLSCQ